MAKVVAVAGKGGSGKTTLAALLVKALLERGVKPLLAVDADPNTNLGEALGVPIGKTLGQAVEDFHGEKAAVPAGMSKDAVLEMRFASVVEERTGFDVLAMGRGEGPGCYCSVNNTLRALVEKLTENYELAVIDNEAGLEHLSRRTQRRIDVLLVVSDFAVRGLRAAQGVDELVTELGLEVGSRMLVVCRAPAQAEGRDEALARLLAAAGGPELEIAGLLPHDEAVVRADLERGSLLAISPESPSAEAARTVLDKVLEKIGATC